MCYQCYNNRKDLCEESRLGKCIVRNNMSNDENSKYNDSNDDNNYDNYPYDNYDD